MNKIIINGMEIFGDEHPHGPQRFGVEVVKAIDKLDTRGYCVEVVVPKDELDKMHIQKLNNVKVVGIEYEMKKFKSRFRFSKFVFPIYVKSQGGYGVDLTLSYPLFNCRVVCVFDCIIKEGMEFKTLRHKLLRFKYLFFEKNAIQRANIVFTISNYSKAKIMSNYHIKDDKIRVCGCGWEHIKEIESDNTILARLGIDKKQYYFSAGVGSGRKNFKWIISAAQNNPSSYFVIAGSNSQHLLDEFGKDIIHNVIVAGYVTDSEYKALLENCIAYIQPSFDEGFGIPPLEALAVGTSAIISEIPVFKELYRGSVHYINPANYKEDNLDGIINQQVDESAEVLLQYRWQNVAKDILNGIIMDITKGC